MRNQILTSVVIAAIMSIAVGGCDEPQAYKQLEKNVAQARAMAQAELATPATTGTPQVLPEDQTPQGRYEADVAAAETNYRLAMERCGVLEQSAQQSCRSAALDELESAQAVAQTALDRRLLQANR